MQAPADFVVLGSGIAGLRALVDLLPAGRVTLITKADSAESNTGYAQGGIAAAIGRDDSPSRHFTDTLEAGAGLCDAAAVEVLVSEGPRYVGELLEWGARFDRDAEGRPALGREGAHSVRRVLHARDATGREIARTLWQRVAGHDHLTVLDHACATRLLADDGHCTGVEYLDRSGRLCRIGARGVLLATGGAGRVFRETTNPAIATGDGVAMAWRAGARIGDLEFVQFHPTVLAIAGRPRFLVSEAVRGEGAHLINTQGERFLSQYDPRAELAPRDVVAAAMVCEAERTGSGVYLTLADLDPAFVRRRFPGIAAACAKAGLDLTCDRLPVSPAAHYLCGGVDTDVHGRTSLPGLFAAGEAACTRVHGANRLASNSLLEGLVFGARAALAMAGPEQAAALPAAVAAADRAAERAPEDLQSPRVPPPTTAEAIGDLMWGQVGLVRDAGGLLAAVTALGTASAPLEHSLAASTDPADWHRANLALVGWLIARAALRREESRGGHRRRDFPRRDDLHWGIHVAEWRPADRP